jgi:hypothetical protein
MRSWPPGLNAHTPLIHYVTNRLHEATGQGALLLYQPIDRAAVQIGHVQFPCLVFPE